MAAHSTPAASLAVPADQPPSGWGAWLRDIARAVNLLAAQGGGYTVATLPAAGTVGRLAYVTDALAPAYLAAVVGGGAVVTPVFDNGVTWIAH